MTVPRALIVPVLVLAAAAVALAQSAPERKEPDVPYVTTPDRVVRAMLESAKVTKDDVVYDLGSGDGRIVIAAAKHFGARAVGIELEPDLVTVSEGKAREAGVADRTRFLKGDIFEADLRDATVVTLYLLPIVNLKLRPKLLRELRPGTRIVSHMYDMGDWTPERTVHMRVGSYDHVVHFWTVPAR
ncbi:MAG: class I SAM-dependent methyltransferase [Candidatus Rokubacteria bacterium]|nr:class I SAM-dependent methyltransferase [Candidatus Rokubacteria bacterium]